MYYDKKPETVISEYDIACQGNEKIVQEIQTRVDRSVNKQIIVFECYPGTDYSNLYNGIIRPLKPDKIIFSDDYAMGADEVNKMISREMTDDRVLGMMTHYEIHDFYSNVETLRQNILDGVGLTIVYGTGASLLVPHADTVVYCELARWEIQLRYRMGMTNWLQENSEADPLVKFKRGYFFEWRVADQYKKQILPISNYVMDVNNPKVPNLISKDDFLAALTKLSTQPYRTVPYFDSSVWGGQWMKKQFNLSREKINYGWAFDGVPEENSLLFQFGSLDFETPAIDLMLFKPKQILGDKVYARFGAEFPIRFDFLDTIGGGNLSLQVHPVTEYIKQHYGMSYTQDESYYILESTDESSVYLGLKQSVDSNQVAQDFISSSKGEESFPAEKYINKFSAKKGDHFLIPAGTVHCGGAGTVILEVSATPYIFTFKMWDWGRVGLDGKPRPMHVSEGLENLQFNRDTNWVKNNLVNQFSLIESNSDEVIQRTGLHPTLEFIETYRHDISGIGQFLTHGSVNMLNVVDGEEAIVESPTNDFIPFVVHFGETFIIPATIKRFSIRSTKFEKRIKVLQAFVR